ncbi:MAG: hypothetical protein WAN46_01495, partial [Gammaproteobacteria bacterium]
PSSTKSTLGASACAAAQHNIPAPSSVVINRVVLVVRCQDSLLDAAKSRVLRVAPSLAHGRNR